MKAQIAKEMRSLRPFWLVAAALPLLPLLLVKGSDQPWWCVAGFLAGCVLLGSASFGSEWNHQTMDLMLVQPVSRRSLWRDKMQVLALALVTVLGLAVPGFVASPTEFQHPFLSLSGVLWCLLPLAWALGVGPWMTLRLGNTIAAFVFTLCSPFAWISIMSLILPSGWETSEEAWSLAFCVFAVPLYAMAFLAHGDARSGFNRLETAISLGRAITLTGWFKGRSAAPAAPTRSNAFMALAWKELHVHEVSGLIAVIAVICSGLIMIYRPVYQFLSPENLHSTVPSFIIGGIAILCGIMVPITAGCMAVAEERQLGLLGWHLTLPPSHRKQFIIKCLVAYAVVVVLGFLLPTGIVVVSDLLENRALPPWPMRETSGIEYGMLGAMSLLLATVCLFSSSVASTSLRAILLCLGTIGLAGAMAALAGLMWNAESVFGTVLPILAGGKAKYAALYVLAVLGYAFLLFLSYLNYRRLETALRPWIQVGLASLTLWALCATPYLYVACQRVDAISRDTGLTGYDLRAYMRDDEVRLIAVLDRNLDDPNLKHDEQLQRQARAVLCTLISSDDSSTIMPVLIKAIRTPVENVRWQAMWGLNVQWPKIKQNSAMLAQAREVLFKELDSAQSEGVRGALLVLSNGQDSPEIVIPKLLNLLEPGTYQTMGPEVREAVVVAVERYGTAAAAASPALLRIAQAEASTPAAVKMHQRAIKALKKINPQAVIDHKLEQPVETPAVREYPQPPAPTSHPGMSEEMRRRYGLIPNKP